MFVGKSYIVRLDDEYVMLGNDAGGGEFWTWIKDGAPKTLKLNFRIGIEGRNYIENKRRNLRQEDLLQRQTVSIEQSNAQNILVGQSVVATNNRTTRYNGKTIFLGVCTLATLVVYTYYSSQSISGKQFLQLDSSLQNNKKTLDSILYTQRSIDLSLRAMASKDSARTK